MTDKLFDSFIKSKLEQHDSGAPMHVWERIKEDKDRKPKGFFFWRNRYMLLLAGLLLGGGATYFLLNRNEPVSIAETINQLTAKPNNAVAETSSNNQSSTNINNSSGDDNTKASNQSASNQPTVNTIAVKVSDDSRTAAFPQQNNTEVKTKNGKRNLLLTKRSSALMSSAPAQSPAINQTVTNTASQEQILSMAGLFRKNNAIPQFKLGNIAMPQNMPQCPTINGPRRRDLYLETYFSPDYNVRSLSTSNATGSYVSDRNDLEKYRTSFSAGVRLVKNMGEKTLVKGGINYTQINERLRIVSENSKQLTQVITIRTVVRSPGDTLFVRDTMYYEQTGTRYRTTYNRYRFIDVPIIFSYEFGNSDLMHFSLNAGPVFNIVSFYKGEVLDTSYSPVAISTKTGTNVNNWRNNIGMGVFASFSIYKKLNDRIHLFGEPYVRYNFNPVTQENNFMKQRYLITGMQLGIRYNFIPPGQRYKK
jgi:hypothetical protein